MLSLIFFIISYFLGVSLTKSLLNSKLQKDPISFFMSIILGLFLTTWLIFMVNIFLPLSISFIIGIALASTIPLYLSVTKRLHLFTPPSFALFDSLVYIVGLGMSFFLISHSLHFTPSNTLQIGTNEWGDFDLHLPLIRSFAWGSNVPPSLLSFPQTNLAYHFMSDYLSGVLEYGGLPLSYAFNLASILGLSALIFGLYKFTTMLFDQKKIIGIFTIIFFLFNSTLGFFTAYQKLHPSSYSQFFTKILSNNHYLSLGPFTSDPVSIIWNMNVYLNQRHLIFSFAIGILLLIVLFSLLEHHQSRSKFILFSILIGLTPLWNMYVFISLLFICAVLGLFYRKHFPMLLLVVPIASLIAIPQVIWLSKDVQSFAQFNPGFLSEKPLTLSSFFMYWWYNLGLSLITIPLGFFLSDKKQGRWFVAISTIFIVGNLVQLNKDMFNNHKLFNFWLILGNGYTAYLLFRIVQQKYWIKWLLLIPLIFFLTFSGIIDMFVVKNETFYTVSDYKQNTFLAWAKTTPPTTVILTPFDVMYDPIRLAGRKTFTYSPRFADDMGYHVGGRNLLVQQLFAAQNAAEETVLLRQNNISYVALPKTTQPAFPINKDYFLTNFPIVFQNNDIEIVAVQ